MPKGGKRAGAGKPKGTLWPSTLDKIASRELTRQLILKSLEPMIAAQIANAQGLKYLVTRDKSSGKFTKVTQAMASAWADLPDEEQPLVEVWEKDPSVQAFTDLLNRALDKPRDQEQEIEIKGELVIKWQE